MSMTSKELRQKFIDFYLERGHSEAQNASLVPNTDSTLLFVNSGMFPLAKYLGGLPHPQGKRLVNLQRCLRTKYDDMLEVGDNRHTLMFEMMGNWSLGDFFKKEQIPWVLKLHVDVYGLDPHRLYVSVWGGDDLVPRDDEAIIIWQEAFSEYGIEAEFCEDITAIPQDLESGKTHTARIFPYGESDNWWQRGDAAGELGGPSSEIFYDLGEKEFDQEEYHINDDSGRFIEIGNNVFMEYQLDSDLNWQPLSQKNIDFGGGFERVLMCVQGKRDIFETDIYAPILEKIRAISGKEYEGEAKRFFRILADHSRAATFILADGVSPSNKDQGYILRRFIRRLVRFGKQLGIEGDFTADLAEDVISVMSDFYPHLEENRAQILQEISAEEAKFQQTLNKGLKEIAKIKTAGDKLTGEKAFYIYETYGFPLEMTFDELEIDEKQAELIEVEFNRAADSHRQQSRAGAEQKFTGGLADKSTETTALHTAHHLLLAALQQILGEHVHQRGSNITAERLRIDFSHPEKLTAEQISEVEELVNSWIDAKLNVARIELAKAEAEEIGAEMEFGQKYGDTVAVYFIGDFAAEPSSVEEIDQTKVISKEFCGGPHVENTSELAKLGKFKIKKEQSSGAGVRRIKAVLK